MICGFCFWEIRENNMNSNSKNTNTFPVFQLKKNIPKSPNQKDDFTSLHLKASHPHPVLGWPLPIPGAQHGKQGAIALDLGQCREPGNESLGGVELLKGGDGERLS